MFQALGYCNQRYLNSLHLVAATLERLGMPEDGPESEETPEPEYEAPVQEEFRDKGVDILPGKKWAVSPRKERTRNGNGILK